MRRAATAALAALVAVVIACSAAVADPVRLREPAALDLATVSPAVPDDGRVAGPGELARIAGRGDPLPAGAPAADGAAVWLAARVANETDEPRWALLVRQAHVARVDLWVYDEAGGGTLASHGTAGIGAGVPPAFALGYELPLALPPGEARTIVLRLEPIIHPVAAPVLAPAPAARTDSAARRLLFPLLLGTFLGMAALHVVLFVRFGGPANLLFAASVTAVFLDWFVWLGGPHDLGLALGADATAALSTATWLVATFFIVVFVLNLFAAGSPRAAASYAALLGAFGLFVAAFLATDSPPLHLAYVQAFLIVSAGILLANGVAAVRRGVPGARLGLAAYAVALANELLTYGSIAVPWLAAFGAWLRSSGFGFFDTGTLLSQILTNGLYSLALWERLRAAAREREAALQAERLKTVHVAQLSHDIRSPLHAVQSAVGALVARGDPQGAAADPRQVELVQSSVRAVVAMLDDMADLARGGLARRRGPADLRQAVADAAAVARAELGDRPVALRVDAAGDVPPLVRVDDVAVRRVLGNLLSNAARATRRGTIAVSLAWTGAPEPRARFEVADTGPGVDERRLAELFGPSGGGGPAGGLGLRVVRRLVEAMGGTWGAASRPGAGTTVWFEVPAPAAPAGRRAEDRGAAAAAPRLRLLLVEDDRLAAAATAAVLRADGHEVTRAGAAAEAVDLAARLPFDLVLMDLGLDAGSGLAAIRAIRAGADPVSSGVPIVVVTGDRERGEEVRLVAPLGVRSVLAKPFGLAELRGAVAEAVGLGARAADSAAARGDGIGFLPDLAAMLAPADLRALLETGRAEIGRNVAALEAAAAAGRLGEARRLAHKVAASAGVLGLGELVAAARAAERAAGRGDPDALAWALAGVRSAAGDALAELDRWLAPKAAA